VQVQSAVCRSRTTCWPLCPYPVRRPPAIFITMPNSPIIPHSVQW
jgi:hypothetical protein